MLEYNVGNGTIELGQGSITQYQADALVCPANADLELLAIRGGVQYAFLSDGGMEIFEEARRLAEKLRPTRTDTVISSLPAAVSETSAHITNAGNLPAKFVIHSVAVKYDPKKDSLYCDKKTIAQSTRNVLNLANKNGSIKSIGFPALGTGLYQVPLEDAVEAMTTEFANHLQSPTTINRIGLILYSSNDYRHGKRILDKKFI